MPALTDLVVVDFTWNLPGPYATSLLAAQGAEVIKIEPPRGDPGRHIPPLFARLNRGKKSVVLDLRSEEGRAQLRPLVERADVLVEGFRPGVIDRLGCSPEQALEWNPRLVFCSISAFGQRTPARDKPGHDLNLQALAGLCHLERDARGRPKELVLSIADLSSALSAVAAIGLALAQRERTGVGQVIDVAMLDAIADWTAIWADGLDLLGDVRRSGTVGKAVAASPWFASHRRRRLYALPHYGLYRCRDDRWIAIGIVDENPFWRSLCKTLGLRGVGRLPLPARAALGPILDSVVRARIRTRSSRHWLDVLDRADVPVTPALSPDEARIDPRVVVRSSGPIPGGRMPLEGPPKLGEHTDAVLGR